MLPIWVQEIPREERSLRRRWAGQSEPAARREAQRSRRRLRRIGPPSKPRPDGTTSRRQIDIKSVSQGASTHERQFENPGIEREKYSCPRGDAPRLNSAFGASSHWRHRSRFSNPPPTIWNREAVSVRSILHLRGAIDHQGSVASQAAGLFNSQSDLCAQYSGGKASDRAIASSAAWVVSAKTPTVLGFLIGG